MSNFKTMNLNYEPIHVSESTFLAGLAERIHRWFRLTPSFGPDLVHEMLNKQNVSTGEVILDPFSGAGTTAIEAKLEGYTCYGFEINPLLHFVGSVSLNWSHKTDELTKHLQKIKSSFDKAKRKESLETLEVNGYTIPKIHNVSRWWRDDVLLDLCILVGCIDKLKGGEIRNFFRLALAGVLVPDLTNVTLGKLQLHFIDRRNDKINVWQSFEAHSDSMISDLCEVQTLPKVGMSQVLYQDSTDLNGLKLNHRVNHVITSPPYPNRYSYVWNTRPHLYLLGFINDGKSATEIDKRTIGGTWGTATSMLSKGMYEPINQAVRDVVKPVADRIRESDNLMANYAMHYFNRLTKHILELEKICSDKHTLSYVVGNSWLKGVYVETDVLLAEILERLERPYRVNEIHRFRRRHSGKDLYESIVYAAR